MILDGPDSVHALGGMPGLMAALGSAVHTDDGPGIVVATSGSTGRPKKTVVSSQALRFSALATASFLGGHGQWLLCLPTHYIAGVQVLVRSILAGTQPALMPEGSFTAEGFATAAATMSHSRRFVSLVPTQLQRVVDAVDSPDVLAALRSFDAILVGGSAASASLIDAARAVGARVITTYGMSETAGGCVYDGVALPGVEVVIEADGHSYTGAEAVGVTGRLWLGGPMVADGYLDDPAQSANHFFSAAPQSAGVQLKATRWYRTDDIGTYEVEGTRTCVKVLGRSDDVIVTGGVKISAGVVRAHLVQHPGVRDASVIAVHDHHWGQKIVAVIVPEPLENSPMDASALSIGSELIDELAGCVRQELGSAAVPKQWRVIKQLPLLSSGKPDRRAVMELFMKE